MKRFGFVTFCGTALLATVAFAMRVGHSDTVLAWSRDGRSALLSARAHGPEGGGSVNFGVVCPQSVWVSASDNFSPGDGSTPQHISETACREALAKLSAELQTRGFDGVTIAPDGCKTRNGMVDTTPAPSAELPKGWSQSTSKDGKWSLSIGKKVILEVPGATSALVSPNQATIVVFRESEFAGGWARDDKGAYVACSTKGR